MDGATAIGVRPFVRRHGRLRGSWGRRNDPQAPRSIGRALSCLLRCVIPRTGPPECPARDRAWYAQFSARGGDRESASAASLWRAEAIWIEIPLAAAPTVAPRQSGKRAKERAPVRL